MCRWAARLGTPIYLEDVISGPEHSLVDQCKNALECKTNINADGFGMAWYGDRTEPGLYKNVQPAWSDPNLKNLAYQVKARIFMAHVRASTGSATSYNNCHPFAVGRWAFMHNGQVGGFDQFRKVGDMLIPDDLYAMRRGATDSEVLFLLALGHGLDRDPVGAMARAVGQLHQIARAKGQTPHMRFSGCWTNGQQLFAARTASDRFAPTLYWRRVAGCVTLVSEPLDGDAAGWKSLASGQCIIADEKGAEIVDFAEPQTRARPALESRDLAALV